MIYRGDIAIWNFQPPSWIWSNWK